MLLHPTRSLRAALLGALTGASVQAQSLTWTNTAPQGLNAWQQNMQGVAFGAGRFVAAGSVSGVVTGHRIAYSSDLVNWTDATVPAMSGSPLLRTAAYGGGLFAIGIFGSPVAITQRLLTSPDGVTWTVRDVRLGTVWGLDYVNGLWIATGDSGNNTSSLATSPDGITWTQRATGSADDLNGAAYGAGLYVAVGNNSQVVTSTDGITWTRRTLTDTGVTLTDVVFAAGTFAASTLSGSVYTSPNGLTWTRRTVAAGARLNSIAYGGGRFVTAGDNTAASSTDGINWTVDTTNLRLARQVTYGSGVFVIGADIGTIYRSGIPTFTGPVITAQPQSTAAVANGSANFSVTATGANLLYQWKRDGNVIPGATSATLTLSGAAVLAGSYTVDITNADGTITSSAATLTLVSASAAGRLINLSVLTSIDAAGDNFTLGYVVGGAGTSGAKPLVVRAAGPSLGALGVPGTLDDPKLELFAGSTRTGENDNWGGGAELAAALAAVGAFPYTGPTSRDAANLASVATRDNSVRVTAANGTSTGTVIAEIYDATPAGTFTAATPRLLNVSVLKSLGQSTTAGFVIGGAASKTVLIRAIGPGLAAVGVTSGTVVDPQLVLYGVNATRLGDNNDWGGTAALSAAFTAVGAFNIPATSRDAALVSTLPPGQYTVEVTPGTAATGLALIEIYDVQ